MIAIRVNLFSAKAVERAKELTHATASTSRYKEYMESTNIYMIGSV
jgi:hypothetical protein